MPTLPNAITTGDGLVAHLAEQASGSHVALVGTFLKLELLTNGPFRYGVALVGAWARPRHPSSRCGQANPRGEVPTEKDTTRLGFWFNKVPVTHELLIRQAGDPMATDKNGLSPYRVEGKEVEYKADPSSTRRSRTTPNIPPYAENWSIMGITPVTEPITLYAMSPHMHLRGRNLRWVIVYPDRKPGIRWSNVGLGTFASAHGPRQPP